MTSLDVQKKRASTKKGIACRFSCRFTFENKIVLNYVAEDSYVIDFEEVIDKHELLTMIKNSFSKFNEKFDLRKLGTVLQYRSLRPLNESMINIETIVYFARFAPYYLEIKFSLDNFFNISNFFLS